MVKKVNRLWTFNGRYHDETYYITVEKLPEELDEKHLKALLRLYVHRLREFYGDGTYPVNSDVGYGLRKLGLVEQVGNGWHPALCWSPQVHKFMQARQRKCKHHWVRCHIPSVYHREIFCDKCGKNLPENKRTIDAYEVRELLGEHYDITFKNAVDVLWNDPLPLRQRKAKLKEWAAQVKRKNESYKHSMHETRAGYGA